MMMMMMIVCMYCFAMTSCWSEGTLSSDDYGDLTALFGVKGCSWRPARLREYWWIDTYMVMQ